MKFNQVILILFVSKCKITLEIPTTCVRILINDVFIKPGIINNLNVSKIQNSIKHSTPIKAIHCQWYKEDNLLRFINVITSDI